MNALEDRGLRIAVAAAFLYLFLTFVSVAFSALAALGLTAALGEEVVRIIPFWRSE